YSSHGSRLGVRVLHRLRRSRRSVRARLEAPGMTHDALVTRYKSGYDAVVAALEGITEPELDRDRGDGGWTPRQVVHHLADSEMTSAIRLRRLLAEERPVIDGYHQDT